jgi:ubiquinone/menaquinone biosynthesis C-methylase UbiE
MTASVSFDRAAGFYDQTRPLPALLAERGLPLIADLAGPGGLILEVGVGTGRISLPLLERGASLVGCDLSMGMMARLRAKRPGLSPRLAQADAARLPYPSACFDVVLTVHVLHLVGDWRAAVREVRRVLRPGTGAYVNSAGVDDHESPLARLRDFWRGRVEARGAAWRRPGAQSRDEVLAEVHAVGGLVETFELGIETHSRTPNGLIDAIASRIHSDTWDIPDDALAESVRELRAWAAGTFADLDQPLVAESRVVLDVARFPA